MPQVCKQFCKKSILCHSPVVIKINSLMSTYGANPCKAFAAPAAKGAGNLAKAAAAAADAGNVALVRPLGKVTPRSAAAAFLVFHVFVINYTIERVFVHVEKKGKKIMRLVEIIKTQ